MANISQFHGEVTKCDCGIVDYPERQGERACRFCFGRGFVATCTACDGNGQVTQDMAGGPGKMSSTCIPCGGVGKFGVNRPEDWVEESAVPESAEEASQTSEPAEPELTSQTAE